MHTQRILELATIIEHAKPAELRGFEPASSGYTQHQFCHICGTPACIAGYAVAMEMGDLNANIRAYSLALNIHYDEIAGKYLDLTPDQRSKLFYGAPGFNVTPEEAGIVLRNLAATGNVDWEPIIEGREK